MIKHRIDPPDDQLGCSRSCIVTMVTMGLISLGLAVFGIFGVLKMLAR